jgi:uncharacterized membrane protein
MHTSKNQAEKFACVAREPALRQARVATYTVALTAVVLTVAGLLILAIHDIPSEYLTIGALILGGLAIQIGVIALVAHLVASRVMRRHQRTHHR